MNMQKTTSLFLAFFLVSAFWVQGEPVADTLSLPPVPADTLTVPSDTAAAKKGFFRKFIDYFADANKEKPYKKFDFSIIGGPNYSEDTKFGIGMVAAGLYRLDPSDSLLAPPTSRSMATYPLRVFTWSASGATTCFPATVTVCSTT